MKPQPNSQASAPPHDDPVPTERLRPEPRSASPEANAPKLGLLGPLTLGKLPSLELLTGPSAEPARATSGAAGDPSPGTTAGEETLPSESSLERARRLAATYAQKSGTFLHPDPSVTEGVVLGLGRHLDELGRALCPCRFYPDKQAEVQHRTWVCPCDDMQVYKYCHCLLFTNEEGKPITEHLPADHEGRRIWGLVRDPAPEKGRALKHRSAEREEERRQRRS